MDQIRDAGEEVDDDDSDYTGSGKKKKRGKYVGFSRYPRAPCLLILIHSAAPQSRPVGIIVSHMFHTHVRPHVSKWSETKQRKQLVRLWIWPSGSLITPVFPCVIVKGGKQAKKESPPTTSAVPAGDEKPTVAEICEYFGLADVDLDYTNADYQNLTTYKLFQLTYRQRIQSGNPKASSDCILFKLQY